MATMLKSGCISVCLKVPKLAAKKMFIRRLHILKKDYSVAMKLSYSKRLWLSRNSTSWLKFGTHHEKCFAFSPSYNFRNYSSIEDDKMLKTWLKEIKKDFKNENKVSNDETKLNTGSVDIESNETSSKYDSNLDVDNFDEDLDLLEKHGFTSDEIIDLLKSSKDLTDETSSDYDSSSDGNYSDSDIESDFSSDSDSEEIVEEVKDDNKVVSDERENKMVQKDWAVVKMTNNSPPDWSEIEIEDFVNIAEVEPDIQEEWIPPVDLVRGKSGVLEVEDVVTILRHANALDIITIKVPPHLDFADYMVITSAKSPRHMKAITSDLLWIYKRRMYRKDKVFRVEGEGSEWHAVDLGNIVLHIFMPSTRELYDLETLWTVGAKFDPKCQKQEDPYTFSVDDLPWLKELEQASGKSEQASDEHDQADVTK